MAISLSTTTAWAEKVSSRLLNALETSQRVPVILSFENASTSSQSEILSEDQRSSEIISRQKRMNDLIANLSGEIKTLNSSEFSSLWISDAIYCRVSKLQLEELSHRDDIVKIVLAGKTANVKAGRRGRTLRRGIIAARNDKGFSAVG